jgi:hypothetical protein
MDSSLVVLLGALWQMELRLCAVLDGCCIEPEREWRAMVPVFNGVYTNNRYIFDEETLFDVEPIYDESASVMEPVMHQSVADMHTIMDEFRGVLKQVWVVRSHRALSFNRVIYIYIY